MTYNLKLTSGEVLTTILPMENNGVDNVSMPRAVTTNTSGDLPAFVLSGNYTTRFVEGFAFSITGGTPQDGEYKTVSSALVNGDTHIYVAAFPPSSDAKIKTTNAPKPLITYTVLAPATSLKLMGAHATGFNSTTTWGEAMQSNMIHVLENFASDTPPVAPLTGQLWFDTSSESLCVFSGTSFKRVMTLQAMEAFLTLKSALAGGKFVEAAPEKSESPGDHGDWFADDSYIYTCGLTGWRRVAVKKF